LAASPYSSAAALIEDARAAVVRSALRQAQGSDRQTQGSDGVIRTEAEFTRVRAAVNATLVDPPFATVSLVAKILTKSREVARGIKSQNSLALLGPLNDIRSQLSGLLHPGFISQTGTERLAHLPRYLEGMLDRLRMLTSEPGKDRARMS